MWRNYLTVGIRSLAKSKSYTFINIFSLTIGLASCLLLLLFVRHHLSYDSWLPNADRVYQIQSERVATEEPPTLTQKTFPPVAAALKKDFPQIEKIAAAWTTRPIVLKDGHAAYDDMLMVDPDFFDILQVPFVRGSRDAALRGIDSLVLTETTARRYFGAEDPLGKTLTVVRRGFPADLRVTGIVKDLPDNTHLALTMVSRMSPATFADDPGAPTRWNSLSTFVYARLRPGADAASINAQLPAWEKRTIPPDNPGSGEMSRADRWALHLENVRNVHLGRFQESAMTPGNDRTTIITFAVVALLILGIACVNFTNLATARASQRAREVALRKVVGAMRRQLIEQFLGESVMIAVLALLFALALVEVSAPAFAALVGTTLHLHYFGPGGVLLPMIGLALAVGIAGGLYPAFYLSGFRPSAILKANQASGAQGSTRLRSLLVVAQFSVSIALIICTAVVYQQTQHALHADAGYKREGLLVVGNLAREPVQAAAGTIAREVSRLDGVVAVARSDLTPASDRRSTGFVKVAGRADPVALGTYAVDANFFGTMGIRTLAGRTFSERYALDESSKAFAAETPPGAAANIVINAAGAKQLGFPSPAAAVGAQVRIGDIVATIVGVVADVQYRSVREEIEPLYYRMSDTGLGNLVVRYSTNSPSTLVARIGGVWRGQAPDVPFEPVFVEDAVAKLYNAEQARSHVFAAAAILAIVIGCLGLYALAAFTAERRTREIGLRKALGAGASDIVRLLLWQFSKPVIVANLVAWPAAWWLMRGWLNGFQDRISLDPALFVGAGMLALAIAAATIMVHALKVARANPIHALRYE